MDLGSNYAHKYSSKLYGYYDHTTTEVMDSLKMYMMFKIS